MCLVNYCGLAHSIYVEWQIMFYNYVGNVIYSLALAAIFMIIVDRPINSLFNVKKYAKLAEADYDISTATENPNDINAKLKLLDSARTLGSL